ncbi:hypothetical protein M413DRAFT_444295 [Hebeloma cylindrosporum]|uniref:PLAC8-domain-containing protein n=1 Tax=Hebeloma cylindrosporum TaxID=76867 RepID=A0A0C3C156_HEBCY|nr:hypothetical protein M413DRAFT_444295 [Hebeloma cylindrosporum h7]
MSEKQPRTNAQPQAVAPMVIPGSGNRNVKRLPYDQHGKRDWSFGLCSSCGECSKCCLACWCPALAHAQNRRRVNYLNAHGVPDPERDRICGIESLPYALLEACCHMGWILQVGTRQDIRERYNIDGGGVSDCCTAYLCHSCDLVQGSRELQLEEESFGLGPTR